MSLPRTLSLACALAIGFSVTAQARTRHVEPSIVAFDRAGGTEIGSRMFIRDAGVRRVRVSGLKQIRKRYHRSRHTPRSNVTARTQGASPHLLVASSGARTSVSTVARPHFTCLLGKLEAVGYRIDFMGGYAGRGNASAHPTGNALDINQTARNVVTRRLPANVTELARDCGLVHGATWSHPDQGHFEMPRKYGYVFHRHRTRYAQAR